MARSRSVSRVPCFRPYPLWAGPSQILERVRRWAHSRLSTHRGGCFTPGGPDGSLGRGSEASKHWGGRAAVDLHAWVRPECLRRNGGVRSNHSMRPVRSDHDLPRTGRESLCRSPRSCRVFRPRRCSFASGLGWLKGHCHGRKTGVRGIAMHFRRRLQALIRNVQRSRRVLSGC